MLGLIKCAYVIYEWSPSYHWWQKQIHDKRSQYSSQQGCGFFSICSTECEQPTFLDYAGKNHQSLKHETTRGTQILNIVLLWNKQFLFYVNISLIGPIWIDLMANFENVPNSQATKLDPILLVKIFHKLVKCYFGQM